MTSDIGRLFQQGDIAAAVEAASSAVRKDQADVAARILLAEMLLFSDDWARADVILDTASASNPGAAVVVAEFRQLLRAAQARRQLVTAGRAPEFLGQPTPSQICLLKALTAARAGDAAEATRASEEAESVRPKVSGVGNDTVFDDFRDADDLVGGTLEVLTTTGKYIWVPVERVESVSFHKIHRPRDLFWRRCTLVVRDGPDGEVYVPAIYEGPPPAGEAGRISRITDWTQATPVRGSGQRVFVMGEDGIPIHELADLHFTPEHFTPEQFAP